MEENNLSRFASVAGRKPFVFDNRKGMPRAFLHLCAFLETFFHFFNHVFI